uniref:Uncharacterized protein n=1 Tax=Rhizophagus irregularis (strain DAOM 181602 / DAOM 197198 / MUCL 43194) TaxID=747089 RepID=U9TSX4_RHIID
MSDSNDALNLQDFCLTPLAYISFNAGQSCQKNVLSGNRLLENCGVTFSN